MLVDVIVVEVLIEEVVVIVAVVSASAVSSLKLTKEDLVVKCILNRTLRTVEITNGACPGFYHQLGQSIPLKP